MPTTPCPLGAVLIAHHQPSRQFPRETERDRQALAAARAIEEQAAATAAPAVVLDDFDATPDAASRQFWRGRRSLEGVSVCYQDTWETLHP